MERIEILDHYWDAELCISEIAAKYKVDRESMLKYRNMLKFEDRLKLNKALFERVKYLKLLNNVIQFPTRY